MLLINLWDFQFKNEEYNNVYKAIMFYISTNNHPPTIANIKEIIYNMLNDNKLPGYLQKIITIETLISIGYSNKESQIYLKRDFLKDYQTIKEDQKEMYQISSISDNVKALESDDKKLLMNKL